MEFEDKRLVEDKPMTLCSTPEHHGAKAKWFNLSEGWKGEDHCAPFCVWRHLQVLHYKV